MITLSSVQIRRGTNLLLDNATAQINPGQKVGLVGKNGCGKSTLFSLIKGDITADAGELSVPHHWKMATVNQETPAVETTALEYAIDGDKEYRTFEQQLEIANQNNDGNEIAQLHVKLDEINAWTIQSRAAALLHGLGFSQDQLNEPVKSFSGGWRMRLNLAQALMCRSDLLLLDEPTNHLDLDAVMWLEKWLKNYDGTLLLISHDRDFLDPLVNKIIHIEQTALFEYSGNYSSFEIQRAAKLSQQQSMYEHQQQKVAHLQSYIDRFKAKASKAKQAQSRIKMLEKMEQIAPAHVDNPFHFSFKPSSNLPNPLLVIKDVVAGYENKTILDKIQLNLVPGSRIGLLGRNGAGKSTLIKLLAGELTSLAGSSQLSKGVKLGYFAQHQLEYLQADESPLWHLTQIASPKDTEQALRNYLGGFDFRGDKVTQAVKQFSGGEKARLVLALIVWSKPNLLLLDEPTNHLDLDMRQALIEALIDFDGALVVVSHDRHLLRSITDEFYLVDDKKVTAFDGDLEDYQKWLADSQKLSAAASASVKNESAKQENKAKRKQDANYKKQVKSLRSSVQKLEQQMNKLAEQVANIELKLAEPNLYDPSKKEELAELTLMQSAAKAELDKTEANWLTEQEALENLVNG